MDQMLLIEFKETFFPLKDRLFQFRKQFVKCSDEAEDIIQEEGPDVKFMVREKGDIITELIRIACGKNEENALIVIKGEINLASIGSIGRNMHIDGLEKIKKIKSKK